MARERVEQMTKTSAASLITLRNGERRRSHWHMPREVPGKVALHRPLGACADARERGAL
jgi:hypothetical protein